MFDTAPARVPSACRIGSEKGIVVRIADLGAAITSLKVPAAGGSVDVVLGYSSLGSYLLDPYYLGSTLGRYANRIAGGRLLLAGENVMLDVNEAGTGNCLHGGARSFSRQFWDMVPSADRRSVRCSLVSPDGDQGFPGRLSVTVDYQLLGDYSLAIDYAAECDAETVVNLANHAYFNLNGGGATIDDHVLQLNAPFYTPVNESLIPTGKIEPVLGTPCDLTRPQYLRDVFTGLPRVFDHNFVLPDSRGELQEAANFYSPDSGLRLVVHTTQPGLQVCTADHLADPFVPRGGICLEAQNFPDAPNQRGFPSARLVPGQAYRQRTIYELIPPVD